VFSGVFLANCFFGQFPECDAKTEARLLPFAFQREFYRLFEGQRASRREGCLKNSRLQILVKFNLLRPIQWSANGFAQRIGGDQRMRGPGGAIIVLPVYFSPRAFSIADRIRHANNACAGRDAITAGLPARLASNPPRKRTSSMIPV
jgi:hypothetical protein